MRTIWNPYSRKKVLVKCGKCEACQQEAACRRSNRIRNHVHDGNIQLFITLTYTNDYVPYIKFSEFKKHPLELNVYRQCSIRQVFDRHTGNLRFVKKRGEHVIGTIPLPDSLSLLADDKHYIFYPHLKGMPSDYIGVCWYPDIQKFYKRLRSNLQRKYNYEKYFSFFSCTELGSHTYRPHAHGLLFVGRCDEALFRSAIIEAWPYADRRRTSKYVELARDCASYVASYVNGGSDLLPLMQVDSFKPKHTYSKDFGCMLDCFKLPQILQKIDSGDLCYYRQQKFDGVTSTVAVPIPKYILYRYFPVCKGFSWLSPSQLRSILYDPQRVGDILNDFEYHGNYNFEFSSLDSDFCGNVTFHIPVFRQSKIDNPLYKFTPQESYRIFVRLENCYKRFHRETGLSRHDYVYYYEKVWPLYYALVERMMHENFELLSGDYSGFYENGCEVANNPDIAPTLSNLLPQLVVDPNKRPDIISKTDNFRSLYSRMNKQRKVTNLVMVSMDHNV